jgi:putative proteasome-type protease
VITPDTPLDDAAKCALVSMDSTLKSNLSVGLPLDLVLYEVDRFTSDKIVCIGTDNPYFTMLRERWGEKLRDVFDSIESPNWSGGATEVPVVVPHAQCKPLKKISTPQDKLV